MMIISAPLPPLSDTPTTLKDVLLDNRTDRRIGPTISRKKRVLFIPASIRSHIIPTLYLAHLLVGEYEIYYAVTSQVLADIVAENGYTPVMNDSFRIGVGMEQSFSRSKKEKAGFWQVFHSVYTAPSIRRCSKRFEPGTGPPL